jgi:hypothetical protein
MINISTYFKLKSKQKDLDFVDVKLDDDNELFIDPRLIEFHKDKGFRPMAKCLKLYVSTLTGSIISNNKVKVGSLLSGLDEPKETRLGYGVGTSNGKSIGAVLKPKFELAIKSNKVVRTGRVNHWSDLELFIENINCDRISDMTTKIIKSFLIEYTQKQCRTHGIEMKSIRQKDILNSETMEWETMHVDLPIESVNGIEKSIIFVPKSIVRRQKDANSNLSFFVRYAIDHYILNDKDFLFGMPKNGKNNTVLKKDIRKQIKELKDSTSKWIVKYKDLLLEYNSFYNSEKLRTLTDSEIEEIIYVGRIASAA